MPAPLIIETRGRTERVYDLPTRLLRDRIVMLVGGVDDYLAAEVCAQLLYLESEDPSAPVYLYINSPGGVVSAGLAVYDTMNYLDCPVVTLCLGQAASMGAVLLAAGTPGLRFALPNSRIMVHQPSGGYQGQASDIAIHTQEVLRLREILNRILAGRSGRPLEEIREMTERDTFFSAQEAARAGIIDRVLASRADLAGQGVR